MADGGQLRVLMVVGPATGGIGAHAASLSTDLRAQGVQVLVFTHSITAARFDFGVPVIAAWPGTSARQWLVALRRLRRLARGAQVVHAQGHQAAVLARLATLGCARGLVVSWHNAILASGLRRRVLALGERWQTSGAHLVTGASSDLVERARRLGAPRTELAPVASPTAKPWTGSAQEARQQLVAELSLPAALLDRPWLVTVSRIAPQKNLHILLAAARILEQRHRSARPAGAGRSSAEPVWFIVGDGDGDLLAELTGQAGASDVYFVGARSDVPVWLAAATGVVLPSAWEARSLVVQEAMAAARPVVASDVGGLPDLLGRDGMLVPPGDPVALAEQVGALLDDRTDRAGMGERVRRRFATMPDRAQVASAWLDRYAAVRQWSR